MHLLRVKNDIKFKITINKLFRQIYYRLKIEDINLTKTLFHINYNF